MRRRIYWLLPDLASANRTLNNEHDRRLDAEPPHQTLRAGIQQGQILLMADVPRSRVEAIEAHLQVLHPEAHLEGMEPNIPAFP